jgi:hypothetical protein
MSRAEMILYTLPVFAFAVIVGGVAIGALFDRRR